MKAHLEAYGITQEVKAMHGICGKKSLRLSKDTGQVPPPHSTPHLPRAAGQQQQQQQPDASSPP